MTTWTAASLLCRPLFVFFSVLAAFTRFSRAQPFSDCNINDYYASLTDITDRTALHALIQSTHRSVLPYTSSSSLDVWDALIRLDSSSSNNANQDSNVSLVYSNRSVSSLPHGTAETWNREHLWPKSLGVGTTGADYTDLHHLRPADWNVNAARGNKWFGECGLVGSAQDCVIPAHSDAANDTAADSVVWLPPANVRGDIARAMFYMDLRYDGDGDNELDLQLTDCPTATNNNAATQLGYKSQLMEWHTADPVDDFERARNAQVCQEWQGNRNPFVDHPELVASYFGLPQEPNPPFGYVCNNDGSNASEGNDTSVSPSPSSPAPTGSTSGANTCNGLQPGNVMVTAFNSDNPDVVMLVALRDLPSGAILFMTDNAWTGTSFHSNEGTLKFVVPANGIPVWSVFGYGDLSLPYANSWSADSGSFALAAAGDSIILYCMENDGSIIHLSALSYNGNWLTAASCNGDSASTLDTSESVLPASLPSNANIALPHFDNYWYAGSRQGSVVETMDKLSNPRNWIGSNTERVQVDANETTFATEPRTSGGTSSRWTLLAGITVLIESFLCV